jgi:hypothetical protein
MRSLIFYSSNCNIGYWFNFANFSSSFKIFASYSAICYSYSGFVIEMVSKSFFIITLVAMLELDYGCGDSLSCDTTPFFLSSSSFFFLSSSSSLCFSSSPKNSSYFCSTFSTFYVTVSTLVCISSTLEVHTWLFWATLAISSCCFCWLCLQASYVSRSCWSRYCCESCIADRIAFSLSKSKDILKI